MTRALLIVALASFFAAVIAAQAQKGRILEPPVPALCAQRK